ncbi:MAG: adenylosuccinate synthase [Vampirovibrionales bacterium]|nr:adenylosuccinate synthase [Vampirovibrionales bacterium]
MSNVIVIGAQWGDEGKAKIVDWLAEAAHWVIRCQGGCNAGHTVKHHGETFKFHLIPSGLLYENKTCIIGSGTVIDPDVLRREMTDIESRGYSLQRLVISNRAHLTLPYHKAMDLAYESKLAEKAGCKTIGTTGRGIGPTYMDKVGRLGLRTGDLLESDAVLRARLEEILTLKAPLLEAFEVDVPTVDALFAWCQDHAAALKPYIGDTVPLLDAAQQAGDSLLFEGAQGTLLDVDYGTYPFVTSSNATAGGICTGSGIGPTAMHHTVGVMKAYTTRVGEGPFPTELTEAVGQHLQTIGQEFGTTTGRTRRCGWFDGVLGRYSVQVNGLTSIALTKLDVLDGLDEIKLAVAYKNKATGEVTTQFPASLHQLQDVEPVYDTLPGWVGHKVEGITEWQQLPPQAQALIARIEALLGVPVSILSVGPERDQTMVRIDPFQSNTASLKGSAVNSLPQPALVTSR